VLNRPIAIAAPCRRTCRATRLPSISTARTVCCGGALYLIGEDRTVQLNIVPSSRATPARVPWCTDCAAWRLPFGLCGLWAGQAASWHSMTVRSVSPGRTIAITQDQGDDVVRR
jgi:hypothetical protein